MAVCLSLTSMVAGTSSRQRVRLVMLPDLVRHSDILLGSSFASK